MSHPSADTPEAILARLVEVARLIEAYRAGTWLLEREQDELRNALRSTGWIAPQVGAGET
jgi:hypothetical protein